MKGYLLALLLSSGADLVTTEIGLSKGLSEANPIRANRPVRIAAHVAAPMVLWQAGKKLGGRRGKALAIAGIAAWSFAAGWNERLIRHAP